MTQALADSTHLTDTLVITKRASPLTVEPVTVIEGNHPIPGRDSLTAGQAALRFVSKLTPEDLLICLISGGGSALMTAPLIPLDELQALTSALLASGARIDEINTIRRHLDSLKGGGLAQAANGAQVLSLILSDVPGDNPAHVASGPTIPDGSTREDALTIVRQYRMKLPEAVMAHLNSDEAAAPGADDAVFERQEHHVIASARVSLEAAATAAREAGIETVILSDSIEGEARDIGLMHAALAREVRTHGRPFSAPVLILSGGETTVTIRDEGYGKGGRNSEFLLSFASAIDGFSDIHALAADTDGRDGSEHNAGAFADGGTIARMREAGEDPRARLIGHDAYSAFNSIGDIFDTGPTGTNVNDFRAILIR
jgi:hydroxypyruvate reductase